MKSAHLHFGQAAPTYTQAGGLQEQVAHHLAMLLPESLAKDPADILEIGCGTGFLTRHLVEKYADARMLITDKSADMVKTCRAEFGARAAPSGGTGFAVMDGQHLAIKPQSLDIIATSMTIQWFDDPARSLTHLANMYLKPGGSVIYATIGPDNFREWRDALARHHCDCGMRDDLPVTLPGQCATDFIERNYGDTRGFLDMLKHTGAGSTKPGYRKPAPRDFARVCADFDGKVTWHIVYGRLDRE